MINNNFSEISLPRDLLEYIHELNRHKNTLFSESDQESRDISINNVITEFENYLFPVSMHYEGSHILEKIISMCNMQHIHLILEKLSINILDMAIHPLASRVLQTIFNACRDELSLLFSQETIKLEGLENFSLLLQRIIQSISMIINPNILKDVNATHPFRTLLSLLSHPYPRSSNHILEIVRKAIEQSRNLFIESIYDSLNQHDDSVVIDILCNQSASPTLQSILSIEADKYSLTQGHIYQRFMISKPDQTSNHMKILFKDPIASHMIQLIVEKLGHQSIDTGNSEHFYLFYKNWIRHNIQEFIIDKYANFIIQTFIHSCPNIPIFEMILQELINTESDNGNILLCELIRMQRYGIMTKILETCCRLQSDHCFSLALKCLYQTLHISSIDDHKDDPVIPLLALLWQSPVIADSNGFHIDNGICAKSSQRRYQILGCISASWLLLFPVSYISIWIKSISTKSNHELLIEMATHPCASHVLEGFFKSNTIPYRAKSYLAKRWMIADDSEILTKLSLDKYGSHIVEACYKISDANLKSIINKRLLNSKELLLESTYGRMVAKKVQLEEFEKKNSSWKQKATTSDSKKRLFQELLEPIVVDRK